MRFFIKKQLTCKQKKRLIAPVFKQSPKDTALIAQSVEQRIENPRVPGSIPGQGTIFYELDHQSNSVPR